MENQRIAPELAFVKSMEYISLAKTDALEARSKIKDAVKTGIVFAALIGVFTMALTQNLASLAIPLVILLVRTVPLAVKANKILRNGLCKMESDREKLEAGEIDPRDYYEKIQYNAMQRGKTEFLDALSDDTSWLSSREREMLAKFSGEENSKMQSSQPDRIQNEREQYDTEQSTEHCSR